MIWILAIKFTRDKQYEVETGFKALLGWCSHFMNQCELILRQRTHIVQKLPKDVEDKIYCDTFMFSGWNEATGDSNI